MASGLGVIHLHVGGEVSREILDGFGPVPGAFLSAQVT